MPELIIVCYNFGVLDEMLECNNVYKMKVLLKPKLEHIGTITNDFRNVIQVIIKMGLIKGCNISRYNYYIIRGLKLFKYPEDQQDKTKI